MKIQDRPKARPLAPKNQAVNARDKLLEEIKSATPINTGMIKEQNSLTAATEEVSVVWTKHQTSHNIPRASSMKAERGEEAAEEMLEASRVWLTRFRKDAALRM